MNIFDVYFFMAALVVFILFILYLIFYYASTNQNKFFDDWVKKTLWLWLPFYALQRLIKEVILKK